MSRFTFSLASSQDDAELRMRMSEDRMEGAISVSFRREPNFFAGSRLQGDQVQVITCRDTSQGRIIGLGSRCLSTVHVNGVPTRAGYLSDLRGDPAYRNGTLLARGYRYLRALHAEDPVAMYGTVILEANQTALASLVGKRAGLPAYIPMGRILTPAIHLDFSRREITAPGLTLRQATEQDRKTIVAFLNLRMATRQFSPVYREADFLEGGRCAGLTPADFYLALAGDRIVGALAAWDQARLRQTHIERYSPALAALRPLYNFASGLSPLKPLPAPGARIPYLYLCCIAIENDDVAVFRALLRFAYNRLRHGPWNYAIAGLHERDPLAIVLSEYRSIHAAGLLYRVDFDTASDTGSAHLTLDGRIPYMEMALA